MRALGRDTPLTIRHRLLLSFLTIITLFAVNVSFFLWSNVRRKNSVLELRQAITAEKSIGEIRQKLDNIQKQITLLSQSVVDSTSGASPEEIQQFRMQLDDVHVEIQGVLVNSRGDLRNRAEGLDKGFAELSASWMKFYENFGVHHSTAILELATHSEPLGQRVESEIVPAVLDAERRNVEATTANFDRISALTDRISILLFLFSGAIAVVIAYRLSHYLTSRLGDLKLGAALIGSGRLHDKIESKARDELGDLANAFNDMADHLDQARTELTRANAELETRHQQVERQRQLSDSLLLNILPEEIAEELRQNDFVEPKYFEDVSILFTDFVGFTLSTEKLAAENLVHLLNDYFTAFDEITARYGIEKLKTIGDAYMCVAGLPHRNPSHPVDIVLAAFELVHMVEELGRREGSPGWGVRVGIHTGPVIAGVVGIKKFAFDVWGESVNYSSRMESSGAANRINLSERTHSRVKDFIACEHRGKILTKDKRELDMYFANGILPELLGDGCQVPPPAFLRRYHVYFQKQPPSFPAFLLESASPAASSEGGRAPASLPAPRQS
jgi:class 3 adenylate cyclase/HAMP domain-containing protein